MERKHPLLSPTHPTFILILVPSPSLPDSSHKISLNKPGEQQLNVVFLHVTRMPFRKSCFLKNRMPFMPLSLHVYPPGEAGLLPSAMEMQKRRQFRNTSEEVAPSSDPGTRAGKVSVDSSWSWGGMAGARR